jgi:hypothetical protein
MNPILTCAVDPRYRREAIAERILPSDLRRGRGAATNASAVSSLRTARISVTADARRSARAVGDRGHLGKAQGHLGRSL